jgi:hypothetical protein
VTRLLKSYVISLLVNKTIECRIQNKASCFIATFPLESFSDIACGNKEEHQKYLYAKNIEELLIYREVLKTKTVIISISQILSGCCM